MNIFSILGDYAVVEFFATKYPATKQLKNKAGFTALEIAQKQGFKRIAYMLETGKPAPPTMGDSQPKSEGPKHSREELFHAAKNGHLKLIKEFVDDRYDSRDQKRRLCLELIDIARRAKQYEANDILQLYCDKQLSVELPSDIDMSGGLRLNQYYQKILLGFLSSLGKMIADSPVVLDPADPNTYTDLFSSLTSNHKERSQEIYKVDSEQDARRLSEQDMDAINGKMTKIASELEKLTGEKQKLENNMQDAMEKLKERENTSATERRKLLDQIEEHKKQLAIYETTMSLYALQQDATILRKNTISYIKNNGNMYLFFRIVENYLQALFNGALAARSGLFTMGKNTTVGKASDVINMIPIPGLIDGKVCVHLLLTNLS